MGNFVVHVSATRDAVHQVFTLSSQVVASFKSATDSRCGSLVVNENPDAKIVRKLNNHA
jgi:hypothetical protein